MAKNTLSVYVPLADNKELEVDIVGITDLIVKDFDAKTLEMMEEAQQGVAKRKKEPRKPKEECERARIRDTDGKDCIKVIWFKKAMAAMGGYFGIPRGTIEQGVYILGDRIPIKHSGKVPTMRSDRVRVGQGPMAKTSIAYRPSFHNWSTKLRIGYDQSVLTPHQVISLLMHAGMKNGVGEWRPQKGGDFGRFQVFPAGASKKFIEQVMAEAPKPKQPSMSVAAKRGRKAAAAAETVKEPKARKTKNVDALMNGVTPPPAKKPRAARMVANKTLRRAPIDALKAEWGVK